MPNLSGIIVTGQKIENPDAFITKYRKVHAISGLDYIHRELKSDNCVICNTLNGILKPTHDQPASNISNDTFLFLEGEVYNIDELRRNFNSLNGLSQCEILLNLFLKNGTSFASKLNGEFNIVIYQKKKRQLTILNDHLASRPLYYFEQNRSLFFGSEKKSILAVVGRAPSLDPLGLLQVFAFSHNLSGRTFIKGLKRLPNASMLTFKDGKVTLQRFSPLKFMVPESTPKIDFLTEKWCHILREATKRRLKNKSRVLINLSGGLDSRAIALSIPGMFRPMFARTKGSIASKEVLYASEIARRLGFIHYIENLEDVQLSRYLPKVVWRTECTVNFVTCLSIANHVQMKKHADFLIGGPCGNVSAGGAITPEMLIPCNRDQFINKAYHRLLGRSVAFLGDIFSRDFLLKFLPALKDTYFNSFMNLNANTNIQLYEIWYLIEKQVNLALSSASVDTHLFEHIRPFLDKNHLNFVLTLPTWLRFGPILFHTMVCRLGPQVSNIPYANTNLNLRNTVLGNAINKCITLGLKGYTKTFRNAELPARFKYQKSAQEGFAEDVRKDIEFRRIIEEFVDSTYFDSSIFSRQGILGMITKHYQQNFDYTFPLCLLATFAVGIPYFITDVQKSCPPEAEPLMKL